MSDKVTKCFAEICMTNEARAEAAEARVAELEVALGEIEATPEMKEAFSAGLEIGSVDMRERAAKLTDDLSTGCEVGDGYDYNSGMEYAYRDAGFRIRALPLDGGDGE